MDETVTDDYGDDIRVYTDFLNRVYVEITQRGKSCEVSLSPSETRILIRALEDGLEEAERNPSRRWMLK